MTETVPVQASQASKPRKQRPTIAFFNQMIGAEWTLRPWWGAEDAARKYDINLVSCIGNTLAWPLGYEEQANVVYALANSERLDGLVIWKASLTMGQTDEEIERFCKKYGVPVVTIEGAIEGSPCVTYQNDQGMKDMIEHLIQEHGFTRIGFLGLNEDHVGFRTRYQAYAETMAAHGISPDPALVRAWLPDEDITGDPVREQVVLQYLKGAIAAGAQAIIGVSDVVAIQIMRLLQQGGVAVPKDVAVVGFDSFNESRSVTPPLTTVKPSWYSLGYLAVETMLDLIDGKPVQQEVCVPHQISVRQSCGCMDANVKAAALTSGESETPKEALQPARVIEEMIAALDGLLIADIAQKLEHLQTAFWTNIGKEQTGHFLSALDGLLREAAASEGDLNAFHDVLSILRRQVQIRRAAKVTISQAENLLHQARVLVGKTAARSQAHQRLLTERRADRLRSVGQMLITNFDLRSLMDVLAEQLPGLDIPACYLALYEQPQRYHYPEPAPEWSRLVLAYNEHGRSSIPDGGLRFRSNQILPDEIWRKDRAGNYILLSLYFQENQIGYVLFETGSREGNIFEALRVEISSALQGAVLVQRVENRAVQLQTAAEVSRAASSILDSDVLSRQVVNVMRERFGLYYTGLFLLDTAGRWAELRAGTGEAGALMLERGHKLEVGGKSLIGQSIAQKRAMIALASENDRSTRFENPLLPDTRSEMALPLISRGEAIGALTVQSDKDSAFQEEDITVLQTMADQVANAIGNARLFEQAQQRAVELARAKEAAESARSEAERARKEAELEKEAAEQAREEAEKARKATEEANRLLAKQMWQTSGQALLNERMRGEQDIPTLANNVIQQLSRYMEVQSGALYIRDCDKLRLASSYAYRTNGFPQEVNIGEGQLGQAALEKQVVTTNVPESYITTIFSASGVLLPKYILAAPLLNNGSVIGAIQLESLAEFSQDQMEFLNKALESIVIAFTTALARAQVNELLSETRQQAEELQAQEEELRATNEELETQTETLRASEAKLKNANIELEEKAEALQKSSAVLKEKQAALDRQNQELRVAQQSLEHKAADLALASKYKSEFLANMSHELRTPLNSMLILAGMLAKNEEGNLSTEQIESAQIIYSGGTDLLNLINEILDLSKVEAGRMEFRSAPVAIEALTSAMRAQFSHVAESKGLEFQVVLAEDLPDTIETDQQRVEQILKNLLSNAFKFTTQGCVQMEILRAAPNADRSRSGMDRNQTIAIRVTDTGIGMTPEQQKIVFEAFQQADGSTSRQYGGTGLGLTISRELAARLGGQIDLQSEVGKGSTFTLYLPVSPTKALKPASRASEAPARAAQRVKNAVSRPITRNAAPIPADEIPTPDPAPALPAADDRDSVAAGDRVLLIIEDDTRFAKIVSDYARRKGFKVLHAENGETGLELARAYDVSATILDLSLPGMSGWDVLDNLKNHPDTRHIPVHIMSAADEDLDAYKRGAMGFLSKPISQEDFDQAFVEIEQLLVNKIKTLLLVEDDANLRASVRKLLEGNDVAITETDRGQTALDFLKSQHFDCMILDLSLPDMSGFDLLNHLNNSDEALHHCPVIVYTGKDLTEEENNELIKYADSVIVKGVKSPERLLDETALFLHRVIANLPEEKQQTIKRLHDNDSALAGKEILIVDDDARNAFALSRLLTSKGLKAYIAPSGPKALEILEKARISLVLMDIMLPGMDGYEVIRKVRSVQRFRSLPIFAVTAKAMKGDREKCIEAGANDYLSKPIDADRLFSMLRVWLSKE